VVAVCSIFGNKSFAQISNSNLQIKYYAISDSIQLDTLCIVPQSVVIKNVEKSNFTLFPSEALIVFKQKPKMDSLQISFRTFPNMINKKFANKSISLISTSTGSNFQYSSAQANANYNNSFVQQGSMDYSGSLSRAITFGNSQDLSLNSQFNLQLNGMLSDSIQLLASLTDNTIPFQPDGTTQNLQEFDRISIELKKRNAFLALGDYDMLKPNSYFMNYYKRVQGVKFSNSNILSKNINYNYTAGASLAKGKYVRTVLPVVEGNQGPYKIQGPNGELFLTILANTEKITVDGILLVRGEDKDYIMDYNIGELTFMPNKMITKDSRVIIEYEFSDRNFINSLLYTNHEWKNNKMARVFVNFYTNQDAKNQSLIQTLSPSNKLFLSTIGDDYLNAFYPSVREDTFKTDRIMYKLIDTIVAGNFYDSIYKFSANADSAKYVVGFTFVGEGKGNYVQSVNIANGRVYEWQAPVGGILKGSFEPYILLITPKRQQLLTMGMELPIGKNKTFSYEVALSNSDPNLFSNIGGSHLGLAHKIAYKHLVELGNKKLDILSANANYELVQNKFRPLENYRTAEFARGWNVAFTPTPNNEYIANLELKMARLNKYELFYGLSNYNRTTVYNGVRNNLGGNFNYKQWNFRTLNSLTQTKDSIVKTQYFRPDFEASRRFKKLGNATIGAKYIGENNLQHSIQKDTLANTSFAFDVKSLYINNGNEKNNSFALTYFTRQDFLPKSNSLQLVNRSQNLSLNTSIAEFKNQQITTNITYRQLEIMDTVLSKNKAEDNLLGRIGYNAQFINNAIVYEALYEFGSGQELRREFAYVQVQTGQGTYTWHDYNNDNIKQLNEFEIAIFTNEKNFIRIFTPGNTYVKAKYNIFNQSISITPAMMVTKIKNKKLQTFIGRWVLQSQLQTNSKFLSVPGLSAYLPFYNKTADTSLLSESQNISTTVFFNRNSQIWNASFQNLFNTNSVLLTYGVDVRVNRENLIQARYNLNKKIMLQANVRNGNKSFSSNFLNTRNYSVAYTNLEPSVTYLSKKSNYSATAGMKLEGKKNARALGGEVAKVNSYYTESKYVISGASSFRSRFTYSNINFTGNANSTLSYIMLDALNIGNNFIFTLALDKKISKGLELNLSYEGRKPGAIKLIHTGNISARAIF
jgi:hypothetical protein